MTRVAILQSCYLPWKGYFDILGMADIFVVYDDVQYSKNHWHNRNQIKTDRGLTWLTVPVKKGGLATKIDEVVVSGEYIDVHLSAIRQAYRRAECYDPTMGAIEEAFESVRGLSSLSEINVSLLTKLAGLLGIDTPMISASSLGIAGDKTGRLVSICRHLGATTYLSGPAAKNYLDLERFTQQGIDVEWMDYSGYPSYPQQHSEFVPNVSIVDLLLNTGQRASSFMKFCSAGQAGGDCVTK